MAFHQPDQREAQHRHADLERQQNAAPDLQHWLGGARGRRYPSWPTRRDCDCKSGEEPEPDHHDHQRVVFARKVTRDTVLAGENEGRGDHQQDARRCVAGRHDRRATVM